MMLDPARVRRALSLTLRELTESEYVVTGGQEPHTVTTAEMAWACDRADARYHTGPCKHVLASYLHRQLDSRVRDARSAALGAA
jgi:hypothetical protein